MQKITQLKRWRMRTDDSDIAQFYGLLKVHKKGILLRPIVSLPGVPIYDVAKEPWRLLKLLKLLIGESNHSINNAQQFLAKIKHIMTEEDYVMLSFDVTALFTLIDLNWQRNH